MAADTQTLTFTVSDQCLEHPDVHKVAGGVVSASTLKGSVNYIPDVPSSIETSYNVIVTYDCNGKDTNEVTLKYTNYANKTKEASTTYACPCLYTTVNSGGNVYLNYENYESGDDTKYHKNYKGAKYAANQDQTDCPATYSVTLNTSVAGNKGKGWLAYGLTDKNKGTYDVYAYPKIENTSKNALTYNIEVKGVDAIDIGTIYCCQYGKPYIEWIVPPPSELVWETKVGEDVTSTYKDPMQGAKAYTYQNRPNKTGLCDAYVIRDDSSSWTGENPDHFIADPEYDGIRPLNSNTVSEYKAIVHVFATDLKGMDDPTRADQLVKEVQLIHRVTDKTVFEKGTIELDVDGNILGFIKQEIAGNELLIQLNISNGVDGTETWGLNLDLENGNTATITKTNNNVWVNKENNKLQCTLYIVWTGDLDRDVYLESAVYPLSVDKCTFEYFRVQEDNIIQSNNKIEFTHDFIMTVTGDNFYCKVKIYN